MRERKCIVSNLVLPRAELIRFVADDSGNVFADVNAKAPGRGVWVTANRESISSAIGNGFARGFKRQACAPDDLADQVESQLRKLCLDLLSMARRGGNLLSGFEKVRSAIRNAKPGWLVEAKDGSEDGRRKILSLCRGVWGEVPLVACFDANELGIALGQSQGNHLLMQSGAIAQSLGLQLQRLSGFTPLIPLHWGEMDG